MKERPVAVKEVATILVFEAVLFIFTAIAVLIGALASPQWSPFKQALGLGLGVLGLGTVYAVLAFGFYNLRLWGYRIVRYLVRVDGLSLVTGLPQKIEQPEVRRAFGLDIDTEARH